MSLVNHLFLIKMCECLKTDTLLANPQFSTTSNNTSIVKEPHLLQLKGLDNEEVNRASPDLHYGETVIAIKAWTVVSTLVINLLLNHI